jgi:hypothetical protein
MIQSHTLHHRSSRVEEALKGQAKVRGVKVDLESKLASVEVEAASLMDAMALLPGWVGWLGGGGWGWGGWGCSIYGAWVSLGAGIAGRGGGGGALLFTHASIKPYRILAGWSPPSRTWDSKQSRTLPADEIKCWLKQIWGRLACSVALCKISFSFLLLAVRLRSQQYVIVFNDWAFPVFRL